MGKKKKSSSPKRWGIKRSARLQSVKNWLSNYNGKNVVKSYRKHFHVDIVCAINELEILGISFSESYKKAVNTSIESKIKQKKERKEKKEEENEQEKLSRF